LCAFYRGDDTQAQGAFRHLVKRTIASAQAHAFHMSPTAIC
jgi:hypothetical protein